MLLQLRKATARLQVSSRSSQPIISSTTSRAQILGSASSYLNVRRFNILSRQNNSPSTQVNSQLLEPSIEQFEESVEPTMLIMDKKDQRIFNDPANSYASRTLALIHACLKLGNIERAKSFMTSFKRLQPQLFKDTIDINVHNAFLEAYLEAKPTPMLRKALEYNSHFDKFGVKANLTTFALLIKGHIRARRLFLMKIFYTEMKKSGFTINQLKRSTHLNDEDLDVFLKAIGLTEEESSTPALSPSQLLPRKENAIEEKVSDEGPTDSGLMATKVAGVAMLKKTLQAAQSKNMDLYEKQLKLEESAIESAMERMRMEAEGRGDKLLKMNITPLRKAMLEWKVKLTELISQEQKRLVSEDEESDLIQLYGKFFCVLNPEKMALIAIQDLLRTYTTSETFNGAPVGRAVLAIGSAIEKEYHAEQMREKTNRYLLKDQDNISQLYSSGKIFAMAMRKIQAQFERERINSNWIPKWPGIAHVRVGSAVLGLLIDSATIQLPGKEEFVPAFCHSHAMINGLRLGVVLFDPYIAELLRNEPSPSAFGPRFLPMLVIPKPWLTYNSGGFLTSRLRAMRCKDTYEQIVYLKRADEMGMLTDVLTSLDVLGSIRWRINTQILDIVKHIWNTGKEFAGIPPAHTEVNLPPKPTDMEESPFARRAYQRKVQEQETLARNNHSMRCDVNYKVEIANAFRDHTFYFPHNLDFRGRAYPIPPLFNHLGNDLCRGLLVFGAPRPLGARGFVWLKIHLANLFGFDKYSFTEREQFTIKHLDDIMDSADFPLEGRRWWLQAEDPWQCLAACQQLTAAIRSGDPEGFPCALPIHQDGTCNGLQHYAALGGDIEGARHVNLLRSDTPQDIYSGVLHLVNQRIDNDAANFHKEALALKGHVTRKVIKQTVMTNVYGVTFIGARAQILSQLKELTALSENETDVGTLSFYLTHLVFASLGEIFSSAQAIQAWLNECAGRISASVPADIVNPPSTNQKKTTKKKSTEARIIRSKQMTSVVWTTPLGLTIVQPYRAGQARDVATRLQTVVIRDYDVATPVNSRKQRTAFPPNFVHSLDASHMMMTALAMQKESLFFASVHDSYWTHACDVDAMNLHIRNEFIKLHSKPILNNLLEEFKRRYKGFKRRVVQEKEQSQVVSVLSPDLILDEDETEINDENIPEELPEVDLPKSKKVGSKSATWADLEFPPLPPRGDFDVSKVADSEYFFH